MQSNTTQILPVKEASGSKMFNSNSNKNLNISTDTIAQVDVSDFADINPNIVHGDICSTMLPHETLHQDSIRNAMLTQYNRIVKGSFKEFFQLVNMNNLSEVLQALINLKELNFVLANRAPELASHYNMPLEPCQITAEEVPDPVRAHLYHSSAYNPEHSIRGRPCIRGNPYHRYTW